MRKFLEKSLAKSARRKIKLQKPLVIAITGSVGKSSAKEAIAAVMRQKGSVRATYKNQNTEIGTPLTVLDLQPAGSSKLGWLSNMWQGWRISHRREDDYPKTLVLEMGADAPGDIVKLCAIAKPNIGIITAIGESHLENFGSVEAILNEKGRLVESTCADGLVVLNRDDEKAWSLFDKTHGKLISFGFHPEAEVRALPESVSFVMKGAECGTQFKLAAAGSTVSAFLPQVLSRHAVYAALAAAAVGIEQGLDLVAIAEGLRQWEPAAGRMRCLEGIKRTILIDDTYNAAGKSAVAALDTLAELPIAEGAKRIAILGDMLELGNVSVDQHREVGEKAAKSADLLVFVGERMKAAAEAAKAVGFNAENIFTCADAGEAGRYVQDHAHQGAIVLVKGSRGMKMEYAVKELMADPLRAADLLVEFHDEWKW